MKTRVTVGGLLILFLIFGLFGGTVAAEGQSAAPSVAAPAADPSADPSASGWLKDLVKLAQSGVQPEVMLWFIDSAGTFNAGADQIIFLKDLGVPSEVINAMIQHDFELISGIRQADPSTRPSSEPSLFAFQSTSPAPAPEAVPSPGPESESIVNPAPPDAIDNLLISDWPERPPTDQTFVHPQRVTYPVREPYPVPLTPPITFIQGEGRTPNVLVIALFPR